MEIQQYLEDILGRSLAGLSMLEVLQVLAAEWTHL